MSRAVIVVNGNYDRDRASQWAKSAPSGCIIEFRQSKRTLDQNARLWACLTEIARKVEWHGMKLPADDWKDIFTAALRKHRFVPGLEENTVVPLGMRTSDMTKQEFSDLLELINAFAAERGIEFQDHRSSDTPSPSDEAAADQQPPAQSVAADLSDAGNGVDEGAGDIGAADGQSASSAPDLSDEDRDWLLSVAKQLWAATGVGEQDLVSGVAGDLRNSAPETISGGARAKALSIVKQCKLVCYGEQDAADTLELIAGIVGVETKDIV